MTQLRVVEDEEPTRVCARNGCESPVDDAPVGPRRKFCTDKCRSINASQVRSRRRQVARLQEDVNDQSAALGMPPRIDEREAVNAVTTLKSALDDLAEAAAELKQATAALRKETNDWTARSHRRSPNMDVTADRLYLESKRITASAGRALRDIMRGPNPEAFDALGSLRDRAHNVSTELSAMLDVDVNNDQLPVVHYLDREEDYAWVERGDRGRS